MTTSLPVVPAPDGDDYPPLSALNDFLFCPRRCALHRLEGLWRDNAHTAAGSLDHRRVHAARDGDELPFRIARGLWVVSHRLRLVGVADLVEFRPNPAGGPDVPYPVEYKRGRRRRWDNDEVQLCAQAFGLEESLGVAVPAGAVYHVRSRRRREVVFDADRRRRTQGAADRLHALLASGVTPPPIPHPKCRQCSVRDLCLPDLVSAPAPYRRAADALFAAPADGR
jgi:CRISPR-associated exonuclease Cas4